MLFEREQSILIRINRKFKITIKFLFEKTILWKLCKNIKKFGHLKFKNADFIKSYFFGKSKTDTQHRFCI